MAEDEYEKLTYIGHGYWLFKIKGSNQFVVIRKDDEDCIKIGFETAMLLISNGRIDSFLASINADVADILDNQVNPD